MVIGSLYGRQLLGGSVSIVIRATFESGKKRPMSRYAFVKHEPLVRHVMGAYLVDEELARQIVGGVGAWLQAASEDDSTGFLIRIALRSAGRIVSHEASRIWERSQS
jgi:hypothetical protein